MKRINLPLVLIFLLLTSASIVPAQSKYDKMIAVAEVAYEKGDYAFALSAIEKFKKKAFKKLGQQNQYTPTYHFLKAKYNLGLGQLVNFESDLKNAIESSISLNQEKSEKHGIFLIDAAELYLQNGSFRLANEYLVNARKILDTGGFKNEVTLARWEVDMGEVLSGQGFYRKSLEILNARERYYIGRAVKQESFVDDKGNLKSRRLPEAEITQRYSDYARLLTLMANTYGLKGNLKSADSSFVYAATWIDKNLGKQSIEYIKNQLYNAKVLVENGNENLPGELEYSRLLGYLKSKHKASHVIGIEIYEEYLKELLRAGANATYLNTKLEYEKLIGSSFKSGSIYFARLRAVELDKKMSQDKTKSLENEALEAIPKGQGLLRNNITTLQVLDFLSYLAVSEKNYANAEKYLSDIIEIKTDIFGIEAPETHLSRVHLANLYVDYTNKINEAAKIYDESFTKIVGKEIGAWHKDHLDILNHMATLFELTDKYKDAIATLDKATEVARSKYSDTDYQYGAELTNIAKLQLKLGQYEKAEQNIIQSLKILEPFRKEEDKKIYLINAIETQATLFGIQGLFDAAEDALDRSHKIITKADNLVGVDDLTTAKELSSLLIQLGRYSVADELLTNLLKDSEKLYGANSIRLIDPLVNKGKLTLAKGDYTEADKLALRANQLAIGVYGENSTKTAPTQKLLSDIDYTIGDYDKAEDNIKKALVSQEKQFGRNHIEVAKSISQLALIKFHKGDDLKEVEKLMLESRDIMGKKLGKDNPQYADILKNVAILYIAQKKYDIAFNSLTQAETIWRTKTGTKNNINAASIYTLTGDVYYELKRYPKAEEFYSKSKDLYEKFFNKNHPEYVKVLSKQAKVYYMEKDYKRAKRNIEEALGNYENFIKQYFPALSEREKAKYWNTIKVDFEFYNTLAFGQLEDFRDLAGKVYNYQLLTKALLLSSSIKIRERILNSQDETLKSSYNLWIQKKEFLTNALSMSTQQLVDNAIDPNALSNEVEKLERELSEKSELFGQSFEHKKITYENVQKALGKNDVALEMLRFRYFDHSFTDSIIYIGMYIKNDNARPKVIELPEGHRMETRYFKYFRNCITSKIPDGISYKIFWEPIQKQIGQYSTIYLSPDGVYNQLNLEAIPTPDGKYVIDNSNIVLVSNTKDIYLRKLKSKTTNASNNATMFGNPTFYLTASASNRSIASLPGTEKEVDELQDLLKQKGYKTNEYTEGTASEEHVKELESPKIFHIATHGFVVASTEAKATNLTENEAQPNENPQKKTRLMLKGAGDLLKKTKNNKNQENVILTA